MHHLLSPLLALPTLLPLLPAGASAQEGDGKAADARPQEPAAAPLELTSGPETAGAVRSLAKAWPRAVYRLHKGKFETGTYTQVNTMSRIEDDRLCQFVDTIAHPKARMELSITTMVHLDSGLTQRGVGVDSTLGNAGLVVEEGRARGQQVNGDAVDSELPGTFVSDFTLLRQLPGLERRRGASVQLVWVDVMKLLNTRLPEDYAVSGEMRCLGQEAVEAEDEKIVCWKYRWTQEGARPVFFWYGDQGQLIKRLSGKEMWLYSPALTRGEPAPPKR